MGSEERVEQSRLALMATGLRWRRRATDDLAAQYFVCFECRMCGLLAVQSCYWTIIRRKFFFWFFCFDFLIVNFCMRRNKRAADSCD